MMVLIWQLFSNLSTDVYDQKVAVFRRGSVTAFIAKDYVHSTIFYYLEDLGWR
jgi:hypothetical protein